MAKGSKRNQKRIRQSRKSGVCSCYYCTGKTKEEIQKIKEQHLNDEIKECLNKRSN